MHVGDGVHNQGVDRNEQIQILTHLVTMQQCNY